MSNLPTPHILATDLDGTFIPLPDEPDNRRALADLETAFRSPERTLIFATGRHLGSVEAARREIPLPCPDWIIADVGVSIHSPSGPAGAFARLEAYEEHLREESGGLVSPQLESSFTHLERLRKQPDENQSTFKLSYFCPPESVGELTAEMNHILSAQGVPFAVTGSVDPAGAKGLIDVLPAAASKHAALLWLAGYGSFTLDQVVYAGDSGNDHSALTSGVNAVLVGNATPSLREDVVATMKARGEGDRLYLAEAAATSGVLEGCRHFGLVD